MELAELGLTAFIRRLERAGVTSVEDLLGRNRRQLLQLAGIGDGTVDAIEAALKERGMELQRDEWEPYKCARHGERAWDVSLAGFFLCDDCARDFKVKAFDGAETLFAGEAVDGYCDHCNLRKEVRFRQWLLCGVCHRVVRSIGRGVAAARFFEEFWDARIAKDRPDLRLEERDPPELRRATGNEKREASFDFLAVDTKSGEPRFGFELKAGRSHLGKGGIGSGMTRFQLDVSDCDDMASCIRAIGVPGYLVHLQVLDRVEPPTLRYSAVDLWWTDMFEMAKSWKETTQRPRENRPAAYFDPKMFRDSATLIDHVKSGGPQEIQSRMRAEGQPPLYRHA